MVYLKSIEIEYLRCFANKQVVDFRDSDGKISQWTVILGDNGTGKTSILKSIVAMLPSPRDFSHDAKFLTEVDISVGRWRSQWHMQHKNGERPTNLKLTVTEAGSFKKERLDVPLTYQRDYRKGELSGRVTVKSAESTYNLQVLSRVYCFAYGANRKMAEKSLSDDNFINVSNTLFDENALLPNSSEYFIRVDYEAAKSKNRKASEERKRIKDLLLRVLPSGVKDIRVSRSGHLQREVEVKTNFGWVRLSELSLGYKTTIAWVLDFATKMIYFHESSQNPFEEPAILVVDEIDLHMHPAWQRDIISSLSKTFPKTQFIVTAHSPLIAQAALASNLVLLKRIRDHVKVENNPEAVRTWRIDQVVTSDLFGFQQSRTPEVERKIARRRKLLRLQNLTDKQTAELERLNDEIDSMPVGETKPEMDAMNLLKDFAARLDAAQK